MQEFAPYQFCPVVAQDLDMLATWQRHPHVRKWWGIDEPGSPQDLADTRVRRWIVSLSNRRFAYMQDYTVHGWSDHHFFDLPQGARGIDQFIGLPDMIGQGHGPRFIQARVSALFAEGAPVVATDPDPKNIHAIAAYKKAGFEPVGPAQETPWGPILPMTTHPV